LISYHHGRKEYPGNLRVLVMMDFYSIFESSSCFQMLSITWIVSNLSPNLNSPNCCLHSLIPTS